MNKNIFIDEVLHSQLKRKVLEDNKTMKLVITELIKDYINPKRKNLFLKSFISDNNSEHIKDLLDENLILIKFLKFYNDFFKDNIDYLMENKAIDKFIEENEEFDKVEEVIEKCQV